MLSPSNGGDLPFLKGERRFLEFCNHLTSSERPEVASTSPRWAERNCLRDVGKLLALLQPFDYGVRLFARLYEDVSTVNFCRHEEVHR